MRSESLTVTYHRISKDLMHDTQYRLYTKERFLKVLKFLESKERYEDCANLLKIMNLRFNHDTNYQINISK
jgi:hypothetical protein